MSFDLQAWTGESVSRRKIAIMNRLRGQMSRKPTPQEYLFRRAISGFTRKGTALWFTFQKVIHVHAEQAFVIDFYFREFKLGIEIDGAHHGQKRLEDQWRSDVLAAHGIKIIRFHNDAVEASHIQAASDTFEELSRIAYASERPRLMSAVWEARQRVPWLRKPQ